MKRQILLITFLFLSCNTVETNVETFEVFPSTVQLISSTEENIDLYLIMYIGSNGCHSFKEIRMTKDGHRSRLRYYAQRLTGDVICTDNLVSLDDTLRIAIPTDIMEIVMKLDTQEDTVIAIR